MFHSRAILDFCLCYLDVTGATSFLSQSACSRGNGASRVQLQDNATFRHRFRVGMKYSCCFQNSIIDIYEKLCISTRPSRSRRLRFVCAIFFLSPIHRVLTRFLIRRDARCTFTQCKVHLWKNPGGSKRESEKDRKKERKRETEYVSKYCSVRAYKYYT